MNPAATRRDDTRRAVLAVLAAGCGLAALAFVAPPVVVVGVLVLALLGAVAAIGFLSPPAVFVAAGLGAQVFSGNSDRLGFPIGPDRLLLAAGLAALALSLPLGSTRTVRLRWRAVHTVLVVTACYTLVEALRVGTLTQTGGFFALLDRLGWFPFLMFALAPLIFPTRRDRSVLLAVLVAVGAYLSATAFFETVGVRALVFPPYVNDPTVGIHWGRARGPFVEAVAMGLALYGCAVASAVAVAVWRARWARLLAAAVAAACLVSTLFTLTRAVWLASAVSTVIAMALHPRLRRWILPLAAGAAVAALAALAFVPGLAESAEDRAGDQRPLWDRLNTNAAALDMVLDEPVFGVGWQRFPENAPEYFRQADEYPITGVGIEVHNVLLSHAAELGLVGAGLWLLAFLLAVGGAVVRRPPTELVPWRIGLVALAVQWVIVASFGPLSYAFPNLLLWLWAGIVAAPWTSEPTNPAPPTPAAVPAERDRAPS